MKIKIILSFLFVNFVAINCFEKGSHVGITGDKMDDVEEIEFVLLKQKLGKIEKEIKKLDNKNGNQQNNENLYKLFVLANTMNLNESFKNIQSVQHAALALYNQYDDVKYFTIHEKFKNAGIIENKKLYDKNYLSEIFNKLWENFEESKVDENIINEGISVWKSFALNFKLTLNTEFFCGKKKESKKYSKCFL
uniref:SCP domain-containing protein n=1 Tax=Meloidogyne hapla TaxID=6305 RepID=A0A1I8AXN4_MELHA